MLTKLRQIILIVGLVWGLSACGSSKQQPTVELYDNQPVTASVKVDSSNFIVGLIKDYRKGMYAKMSKIIGYSSIYMPNKDKPEGLLSNLVADFTCQLGKDYCKEHNLTHSVDASIINIGGLRKGMPVGDITLGDIYEVSPFENKLFIVAIYGKDLRQLFDHITRSGGEGIGNIRLVADAQTKKLRKAFVAGKPLEDNKIYHIISIDYLINGGDGMVAFSKALKSIDMNLKSRDALLQYVQNEYAAKRPLTSKLDNRISYE